MAARSPATPAPTTMKSTWEGSFFIRNREMITPDLTTRLRYLSSLQSGAGIAKKPFQSPHYPADGENDQDQAYSHDHRSHDGMLGGKPRQRDRHHIFTKTERHIGEGFRGRSDCRAHGGLATMRGQCDQPAYRSRSDLCARRKMLGSAIGEHGRHRYPNKCMQCIPQQVENRNFVGKEFNGKKHA